MTVKIEINEELARMIYNATETRLNLDAGDAVAAVNYIAANVMLALAICNAYRDSYNMLSQDENEGSAS